MHTTIDSYAQLDFVTRRIIKAWVARERSRPIPWTPLRRPLSQSTVALVSSAGIALHDDRPFDEQGERRNPWWGDPSHRVVPHGTTAQEVGIHHMHIDRRFAEADLDVVLPSHRLEELVREGIVGRAAPEHYSIMGYILRPEVLETETAPTIAARMRALGVDAAVLVPV
ncbi:MAG TPA: glycine/sarcosine/betaine reductase selenoprotein B family protein [Planctomycetota bacterium]|nr:glycine/sarcosine/betaine reductase selenoprotein B family protein [Planctomycetota bacterium]